MNLLAAAGAAGSPVRKVVLKSSTLVYGSNFKDPYCFREDDARTRPPRTQRRAFAARGRRRSSRDFADDNPHVTVT